MVDGMDLSASMHNLTQMDKFQQDSHQTPIHNQEQNQEAAKEEAARRLDMPVQPDEAEGKTINPDNRKKHPNQRKKKKKKKQKQPPNRGGDTGHFVDFSA